MIEPSETTPTLTAHAHLSPDDGICLMELVSLLAGEPFSDHPRCTDPTLATIGRVVNDELSTGARQALVPLARDFAGRREDTYGLAPVLVQQCLAIATEYLPMPQPTLQRHHRRAAAWITLMTRQPKRLSQLVGAIYVRGPAQHAIGATVRQLRQLPATQRDAALWQILDAAVAATPRGAKTPPEPADPKTHAKVEPG